MDKPRLAIPVCLDSGAFSAYRQGKPVKLDDWIEFLLRLKRRYPEVLCVNLDVIPKGRKDTGKQSYDNWIEMRKAGLDPMPVYHPRTDLKFLKLYMDQTDYLGLGAMARVPDPVRIQFLDRIWNSHLLDATGRPKVKVHGMGLTSFSLMSRYPWYSFDSTSYLQPAVYGKVYVPRRRAGSWDYSRPFLIGVTHGTSWRKQRGLHMDNCSPAKRQLLMDYLETIGMGLGKSCFKDGKELVTKIGITNHSRSRVVMNALCFMIFSSTLLGYDEQPPKFYYGGSLEPELDELIRNHRGEFTHVGRMYSFFDFKVAGFHRFCKLMRSLQEKP